MACTHRWIALLVLAALAGCGGGGGGGSLARAPTTNWNFSGGGPNVVALTVDSGPAAANGGTFNIPYTSITLCVPGPQPQKCATIDHVLVDTGSSGLRMMGAALANAGLTLPLTADPINNGNTLAECTPFADGYTWGPLATVDLQVGGESANGITINIIDDSAADGGTPYVTVPPSCTGSGSLTSLNSIVAFAANGVLGVGLFAQDCGPACANCGTASGCAAINDLYYSCNANSNPCPNTPVQLIAQVQNPVSLFATDNNGVILQLQSIPASGAATASGYLVFGIGTQSNNPLGTASVLTVDSFGDITTVFNGQTLTGSFIDSGSNGYFFPDSSLTTCSNGPQFYCPPSTQSLTATNQGQNGNSSSVNFQIANLQNFSSSIYAIDDAGGVATAIPNQPAYFDWGLPFFYGRTVFTAIENTAVGSVQGPFYAY